MGQSPQLPYQENDLMSLSRMAVSTVVVSGIVLHSLPICLDPIDIGCPLGVRGYHADILALPLK